MTRRNSAAGATSTENVAPGEAPIHLYVDVENVFYDLARPKTVTDPSVRHPPPAQAEAGSAATERVATREGGAEEVGTPPAVGRACTNQLDKLREWAATQARPTGGARGPHTVITHLAAKRHDPAMRALHPVPQSPTIEKQYAREHKNAADAVLLKHVFTAVSTHAHERLIMCTSDIDLVKGFLVADRMDQGDTKAEPGLVVLPPRGLANMKADAISHAVAGKVDWVDLVSFERVVPGKPDAPTASGDG